MTHIGQEDAFGAIGPFGNFFGLAKFFLQASQCQLVFDPDEHFFQLEWLGDIIDSTDLESLDFVQSVVQGTEKNDQNIAGALIRF